MTLSLSRTNLFYVGDDPLCPGPSPWGRLKRLLDNRSHNFPYCRVQERTQQLCCYFFVLITANTSLLEFWIFNIHWEQLACRFLLRTKKGGGVGGGKLNLFFLLFFFSLGLFCRHSFLFWTKWKDRFLFIFCLIRKSFHSQLLAGMPKCLGKGPPKWPMIHYYRHQYFPLVHVKDKKQKKKTRSGLLLERWLQKQNWKSLKHWEWTSLFFVCAGLYMINQ